jgi:hypothetical protein
MSIATCLNFGASEQDRPLITLKFQQKELYICPQCPPTLIHKPYQPADKIPGSTLSENSPEHDE